MSNLIQQLHERQLEFIQMSEKIQEYTIEVDQPYQVNQWLRQIYRLCNPYNMFLMKLSNELLAKIKNPKIVKYGLVFGIKIDKDKQIRLFPCDHTKPWTPKLTQLESYPELSGVSITANNIKHPLGGFVIHFSQRNSMIFIRVTFTKTIEEIEMPAVVNFRKNGLMSIMSLGGKLVDVKCDR